MASQDKTSPNAETLSARLENAASSAVATMTRFISAALICPVWIARRGPSLPSSSVPFTASP
ncbi:hypothetical protein [uncultured Campylobacter sp.]|uniref:hypothetical protein n=1 Tax=uncultured Campylobacter sp. TaxID=218934 RepID=UPI00345C7B06